MKHLLFMFLLTFQLLQLPTVKARIDSSDDNFESSIEGYKKNEFWGIWAVPLSDRVFASNTRSPQGKSNYNIKNIQDLDLNTAWAFTADSSGGETWFEYKFDFPPKTKYAGAYQFNGVCGVFNGYCKSLAVWKENGRVKNLSVYLNNKPVCKVMLLDTWHFQTFDISRFFKNEREGKYLNAKYEIRNGDKLRFVVTDVYEGSKYSDVAMSEFLCEGGTN